MNKPKPDDRLKQSMKRIKVADLDGSFQKHLQDLIAYEQDLLVNTTPESLRTHQGRVMAFREILTLLTE